MTDTKAGFSLLAGVLLGALVTSLSWYRLWTQETKRYDQLQEAATVQQRSAVQKENFRLTEFYEGKLVKLTREVKEHKNSLAVCQWELDEAVKKIPASKR
jgi:hypothetical protein